MFDESGAVQAVEVVGGPTSEENKDITVRMFLSLSVHVQYICLFAG